MKTYPLKSEAKWRSDPQYDDGKLEWMAPAAYLARVPAVPGGKIDHKKIAKHKKRMENGDKLKPLAIYSNGAPNGRHRALAAAELGIKRVPVLVGGQEPAKYPGKLKVKREK